MLASVLGSTKTRGLAFRSNEPVIAPTAVSHLKNLSIVEQGLRYVIDIIKSYNYHQDSCSPEQIPL